TMLFILCMEPLRALFHYATEKGMLAPLARSGLKQWVSMFADDVVVFFKPNELEARTCDAVLQLFGQASGLVVNRNKSMIMPIRCSSNELDLVTNNLGCPSGAFPCKYLSLPLTLRKQTAAQLQGLVDKVGDALPLWKAALLPKSSRLLLIQSVLCAIPVHSMLVMDLPAKTISAVTKICRGFLWCGNKEAHGGNCSVSWEVVSTPKWAGGLGIANLKWLNKALQARWPWLQKYDKERPWAEFQISVLAEANALVQAAAISSVGDGKSTIFWEDKWLDGSRIGDIAPLIYDRIPRRIRQSMRVSEALNNNSWVASIGTELSAEALLQFLRLWLRVVETQLLENVEDTVRWSWESNGQFSARSAYAARFLGMEVSPEAEFTWDSRAPLRCRFFSWRALKNR
uniref:Reverse transcriptase domain-containing protein n=1 Tax=Aegilops tauschii subsp. strangulata TaxID=200361 RepID=A0A453L8B3_AEGTS